MPITDKQWKLSKRLFANAMRTSFHYAVATVGEDGSPHVTPIGSLMLRDNGKGYFFDGYLGTAARNLKSNNRVCILAVHSNKWLFLKSLFKGRFVSMPAVRLTGTVGERREATPEEMKLFQKRFGRYRIFKGYDLLWGRLRHVREITFDKALPVNIGVMSQGLWPDD
jgi:uncharacterized protein